MGDSNPKNISSRSSKGKKLVKKKEPISVEELELKSEGEEVESGSEEEKEGKEDIEKYISDQEKAFNLAQVKINALRMLETRGYQLDRIDSEIVKMKPEVLAEKPNLLLINKSYEHETSNLRLHLIFLTGGISQTINKPIIQKLLSALNRGQKPKVLVMIGDVPLGAKAVDKLLERKGVSSEWFIQFFRMEELLYSPIQHDWCPRYVKLTDDEKINLRRIEGIAQANLPLMRYADLTDLKAEKDKDKFFIDPICKYYGFQPNDIVKEIGSNIALNFLCPKYLLYRRVGR
jgi:hypothetical protein